MGARFLPSWAVQIIMILFHATPFSAGCAGHSCAAGHGFILEAADQAVHVDGSAGHGIQVLPWYQFQAEAWHRGEFPLWDPHVWGGQPLIGQMQPGAAYPLNWPLFLMPLKKGHIQTLWMNLDFI